MRPSAQAEPFALTEIESRHLLTGITDPFAIRQVSLGPAKQDRYDSLPHSE